LRTYYQKRFLKDLSRIPAKTRNQIEKFVFEDVPQLQTIEESVKIERMVGYPSYYKIRFGVYRVGLKKENDNLIFIRALHRKEIYRYFP
jgi:mRNA interferase RelE/StbE